ncbi:MAG: HAMP domain-containing protein, partial [Deltaproteobacteria bacterium]|nr:HAMP domain-containing protein [Deltaproteobacteria bacterium]
MAKLVLFRGTSLQTRVRRVMLAVVAGVVVVQAAFSVSALRDSLLSRARFQGAALARALAADPLLRANLWAGNAEGVAERLDAAVRSDPDAVFAAVIDGRGQLTMRTRPRADIASLRNAVLGDVEQVGDTQISRETLAQEAKAAGAMNELGELGEPTDPAGEPPAAQEAALRFAVGTDTLPAQRETTLQIARSGALALVALGAAWGARAVLFGSVFRRIERTKRQADELAAGNLSTPIKDEVDDEIGTVANSIESIRAQWARIVGEIRQVTRAVVEQHD